MTMHPQSSPNWVAFVRSAAEEIDALFPRPDWTSTYPGHGENSAKGAYAIDFMCSRSKGDQIAAYVWKNRVRLGVWYIIWYGRIKSRTDGENAQWKRYFNAGSSDDSKAHRDHVHVSFYPKARIYIPPTGSKPASAPKPSAPLVVLEPGNVKPKISEKGARIGMERNGAGDPSKEVKAIQDALNRWRPSFNLIEDGYHGRGSRTAAATFQGFISAPPKPTPWPNAGWDENDGTVDGKGDADGILGAQSLTALGFDVQP